MTNCSIFIIIIIIILFLINFNQNQYNYEKFNCNYNYPYAPKIDTVQSNYDQIIKNINDQQKYKKNIHIALNPIPTIQCQNINQSDKCIDNGCNWFGTFCSGLYPSYL